MKSTVIGIDVGKHELAIFWQDKNFLLKNDEIEIEKWIEKQAGGLRQVSLIAYEPTGGYERKLQNVLQKKQLPHRRVHANHVRDYARASGVNAKTDRIDAKVIADYATRMEITAKAEIADPNLKALLTRRRQLIDMRTQEKNRLDTCDPLIKKLIEKHVNHLTKEIGKVDKTIKECEVTKPKIKKLVDLYTSVPGIGRTVALQLVADLPELETADNKKLAALVGVAPWNHDSGLKSGRRRTKGGRTQVRSLLYMAALVAARFNPELNKFYNKLKQKGKASKVALIAIAHKLLYILRSIAQRQTPWVAVLER